ncbi:MAG: diguanylate cyclase [Myxococcota bacterium]
MGSGNEGKALQRRIGRRLALWLGGSALVLGAALALALVPLERRALEQAAVDQVGLLAEAVASTYEVVDEIRRLHPARDVIEQVARAPNVLFVDVLDHRGQVQASSMPEHRGQRHQVSKSLRSASIEADELVVAYRIPWTNACVGCHQAADDPVGAVRVGVNREAALRSLERFHVVGGIGALVIFTALVLLLLLLSDRLLTRPLFALARVMQRAEQGDFLVRAEERDDEVGSLGAAFNSMLRAMTEMKANEIDREADLEDARKELSFNHQLEDAAEQLARSNLALERRVRAQVLLMEAAHQLGGTLNREALLDRLCGLIERRLGCPDYTVFVARHAAADNVVLHLERAGGVYQADSVDAADITLGEGMVGLVAETGAMLKEGREVCVPMLHQGKVVGALRFCEPEDSPYDEEAQELLQALSAQAAMAVVNADLYEATVELSVTDPLTNLMNRRALNRRLDIEITRAQRFGLPLALLVVDVDHFKQYNDRMGHLLGDEALKAVARALDSSVRKVDAVARFGGEEFCVILPRTDEAAAFEVATKLGEAIRAIDVPGARAQPLGHLSISVGLAVYPDHMPAVLEGAALEALLEVADKAVYEAKHGGRDRVVSAALPLGIQPRPALERRASAGATTGTSVGEDPTMG